METSAKSGLNVESVRICKGGLEATPIVQLHVVLLFFNVVKFTFVYT